MKTTILKSVMMVLTALFSLNTNAYDVEIDVIYYNLIENTKIAEVARVDNKYRGDFTISELIEHNGNTYTVTSIGKEAFSDCSGLTSITIPNSVTSIGERAFASCSGLTSITIPNSVTAIGKEAFSGCYFKHGNFINNSTLTSEDNWGATLCDEETVDGLLIKDNVVIRCRSWATSVTIPNSVTAIRSDAFSGRGGLTSVTIPNSITSIGSYAFASCSGLTSITIPNSVTAIGERAFYGCGGLTSITIPNSVTAIGKKAFSGCYFKHGNFINNSTLTSEDNWGATLCDKETVDGLLIKDNVVIKCRSWATSVTIPNSVTAIGGGAFHMCSGLTSIIIPNSVTSIGDKSFQGCSGLTSITIPNSVTAIGYKTFAGCGALTSITIPNSVTSIDETALSGSNPISVTILCPMVGRRWFRGKSSIKEVILGDGVTSIEEAAFSGCGGLTSITIPNSVTAIGSSAFSGCGGLTSVTIPNSVTSIGGGAFSYCSGLPSITIPNSVTSIGERAFAGCLFSSGNFINNSTLTSEDNWGATLCDKETVDGLLIKDNVVIGCRRWATSVTIPNSVTAIGSSAFSDCGGLTSVTIPNSVTSIGSSAFYGCYFKHGNFINNSTLTSEDNWGATLCDEETVDGLLIKDNVVIKCRRWATSVTIPNSVTSIGERAFASCSGLTSVTIPNSVTAIGSSAFYGCGGLTSVTIPNSVTEIGYDAFYECNSLTSVTSLNPNPPSISFLTFVDADRAILKVPIGSKTLYWQHPYWGNFLKIEEIAEIPSGIDGVITNDDRFQIYTLDGKPVDTLQKGVNIIRYSNGQIKKVFIK